jgi:aryl-alcohol dehydrogenase-like predicted oxidoreductase
MTGDESNWLRPLGKTGLEVSALGLGTVKLGRNQAVKYPRAFKLPDDASASALLDRARGLGINLLDTAPAYGDSEQRLGKLLAGQREHWLLCTKVGEEFDAGSSRFDFSPAHTRASVQRSLRRLATDRLDIVLVHSDGNDLEIIEQSGCLETLAELKLEGLIRAFGMSTKTVTGGIAVAQLCDVVMLTYNLETRAEQAVLDACLQRGVGTLIKKPLASGHLDPSVEDPVQASMDLVFGQAATSAAVIGTIDLAHLEANVVAARRAIGAS